MVVAVVVAGCTGGTEAPSAPVGADRPPDPAGGPAAAGGHAGGAPAPERPTLELQAGLSVQLELRTHLLVSLATSRSVDDEVGAAAAGGPVLAARRRGLTAALLEAGDVGGTSLLEQALTAEDDLVLAHLDPGEGPRAAGLVARQVGAARRSAAAWSQLTAGRLPQDVAEPMTAAHLAALVAAVDGARREGVASVTAVAASLDATERLVDAVVGSLRAELRLAGDPVGDAAELRRDLTSALVQDGLAAASGAAGLTEDDVQAGMATDRLTIVVQRHYGADLAARTGDAWVAAREDAVALQDALRLDGAARRVQAESAVAEATVRAGRSATALAALLAEVVGDHQLAPTVERLLDDDRSAIEVLSAAGAGRSEPARWRSAADAAVDRVELAVLLAGAITRHKSLG